MDPSSSSLTLSNRYAFCEKMDAKKEKPMTRDMTFHHPDVELVDGSVLKFMSTNPWWTFMVGSGWGGEKKRVRPTTVENAL